MTGAGCWLTWRARSLMAARRSATSGVIGDQGELFGPVASVRAVWRALAEIAAGGTVTAGRVTAAVNAAGRGAWAGIAVRHGAQPGVADRRPAAGERDLYPAGRLGGDLPFKDKELAEPNFKGFGYHPLMAYGCGSSGVMSLGRRCTTRAG